MTLFSISMSRAVSAPSSWIEHEDMLRIRSVGCLRIAVKSATAPSREILFLKIYTHAWISPVRICASPPSIVPNLNGSLAQIKLDKEPVSLHGVGHLFTHHSVIHAHP